MAKLTRKQWRQVIDRLKQRRAESRPTYLCHAVAFVEVGHFQPDEHSDAVAYVCNELRIPEGFRRAAWLEFPTIFDPDSTFNTQLRVARAFASGHPERVAQVRAIIHKEWAGYWQDRYPQVASGC